MKRILTILALAFAFVVAPSTATAASVMGSYQGATVYCTVIPTPVAQPAALNRYCLSAYFFKNYNPQYVGPDRYCEQYRVNGWAFAYDTGLTFAIFNQTFNNLVRC